MWLVKFFEANFGAGAYEVPAASPAVPSEDTAAAEVDPETLKLKVEDTVRRIVSESGRVSISRSMKFAGTNVLVTDLMDTGRSASSRVWV